MRQICLALSLAIVSSACGGSDKSGNNGSSNTSCDLKSSYDGAIGNQNLTYSGSKDAYEYLGELTASASNDVQAYVFIQLFNGFGVFKNGVVEGTFSITGDEANYATCGLCVSVLAQGANASADPIPYAATAGSVTITSVGDTFTATLSGVKVQHIDIADNGDVTVDADGCKSSLGSASVSASIEQVCSGNGIYDGTFVSGSSDLTAQGGAYTFSAQLAGTVGSANTTLLLDIQALPGYGAFTGMTAIAAGTYTLTGNDLNYASCGLCVRVVAVDNGGTTTTDDDTIATFFLATGGTVRITTADATTFAGSLDSVTFEHVTIGPNFTSTPASDAATCTVGIAASTFSGTVTTN